MAEVHTRVVRQHESVASYTALVTPTVFGCKIKSIQKATFPQALSTDNFVIFGHPWGMVRNSAALKCIPEILTRTLKPH